MKRIDDSLSHLHAKGVIANHLIVGHALQAKELSKLNSVCGILEGTMLRTLAELDKYPESQPDHHHFDLKLRKLLDTMIIMGSIM